MLAKTTPGKFSGGGLSGSVRSGEGVDSTVREFSVGGLFNDKQPWALTRIPVVALGRAPCEPRPRAAVTDTARAPLKRWRVLSDR